MIKHETAFDLFQRLNIKDNNQCQLTIDRLNRYNELLFPNDLNNRGQLIELLDNNRPITKTFLHGFISDYIDYMKYHNELLKLSFKSEEILSHSPRADKNSDDSEISSLQMKLNSNESIHFIYIDTEYKECPFDNNEFIEWYDCQTSSELISTLLRFEQLYFINDSNRRFILIIDSSSQIPINDYFYTTTSTYVMPIEENKLLTMQWHTMLYQLVMKYKLSCILIEHLDIDIPMFDTIIRKHDEKLTRRNRRSKEFHHNQFSDFAFGRLMNSERYMNDWNHQLEYRQINGNDMLNFLYDPTFWSLDLLSSLIDEALNDDDENDT